MSRRSWAVSVVALFSMTLVLGFYLSRDGERVSSPQFKSSSRPAPRLGNDDALREAYEHWTIGHEGSGGDRDVVLAIHWSKGLSKEFTQAQGQARLDLIGDSVRVEVSGLPAAANFGVWLVDNLPGAGRSVAPEPGDAFRYLGPLQSVEGKASLDAQLVRGTFRNFEVDLVMVAATDARPEEGGLLFGTRSLFQRWYSSARGTQPRLDTLADTKPGELVITLAAEGDGLQQQIQEAIAFGEDLFFNETFSGNGRTCATCHPAVNNFAIDPAFIATLPPDDPLFVAEFVPELSEDFENPVLMREFGLILENTNGFGNVETMRGVPHTLALNTSLGLAGNRTGWSGDGAPGAGTLRDFATGAVTQHFPKTLGRVPGVDFRLPTDLELDAMEAFQLSLGRQTDLDLDTLNFKNAGAQAGKLVFNDAAVGKCARCHFNAGANRPPPSGDNANFDTGVEDFPHPAGILPPDDGFGNPGDGRFNTTPLVEAADTGPFFHNNVIETIEGAVAFYNSSAFNASPSGTAVGGISLSPQQVNQVGAFLRVINALENIRSAECLIEIAKTLPIGDDLATLSEALAETDDGIEVLEPSQLRSHAAHLHGAHGVIVAAMQKKKMQQRNHLLDLALDKLSKARDSMVE